MTVSSFWAARARNVPSAYLMLRSVGLRSVRSVSSSTLSFLKPAVTMRTLYIASASATAYFSVGMVTFS